MLHRFTFANSTPSKIFILLFFRSESLGGNDVLYVREHRFRLQIKEENSFSANFPEKIFPFSLNFNI